jgi:N-acetylglucosaminyl-diphospho-decaprenol L-rhamnosyltransferase
MKVLVVIVNYRTPALTIDCLQSLAPEVARLPGTRVVVTDNASPDDSVPQLTAAIERLGIGDWCTLLPLPKNGGFAYGNNEGIRPQLDTLKPDAVWLLNPDTIVLDGALTELVKFMEARPQIGIAGGRAENRDGTVRRSCFRFHSPLGELEGALKFGPASKLLRNKIVAPPIPDVPEKVDWVSGASMMVRREVFEKIGLLDDGYFMYYEETDFCLRAARAGFDCWYVPQSRIIHLVGQSSGVTGAQKAAKRRPKYWFDSRYRYFRENFGFATTQAANLLWVGGYPLGRLWLALRGKEAGDPPKLWWDFVRYNYTRCRH